MDALPDELLLHILSYAHNHRDPVALLEVVPLVCKRWHRLSKDPRAWARVSVQVPCCFKGKSCNYTDSSEDRDSDYDEMWEGLEDWEDKDEDSYAVSEDRENHNRIADESTLIEFAPFLHRLEWDSWDSMTRRHHFLECGYESAWVLPALRRSKTAVRELILPAYEPSRRYTSRYPMWRNPLQGLKASQVRLILALMIRSKRSMRVLQLGQLLASERAERALSKLSALESLRLTLDPDFVPTGLLEGALPRLRRLQVACFNKYKYPGATSLVTTLVRGAAGRLRHLHLYQACAPLCSTFEAEVRRCEGLVGLTCSLVNVAVLPALPQLRWLQLHFDCNFSSCVPEALAALTTATQALRQGGPLARLTYLRADLRFSCYFEGLKTLEPAIELLLEALAAAASEVTTLHLQLTSPYAALFLARMRRLRSVRLSYSLDCPPIDLAQLASLPELRTLVVCPSCALYDLDERASEDMTVGDALGRLRSVQNLTLRGCSAAALAVLATLPELKTLNADVEFYRYGEESEQWSYCKAAVADFKRQRPDVKSHLSVVEGGLKP